MGPIVSVDRYYALYSRNDKLETDKSKYNQLHLDDVRRSADGQQRWTTTSQPAFGAEPQYYLYAADSNNVWERHGVNMLLALIARR